MVGFVTERCAILRSKVSNTVQHLKYEVRKESSAVSLTSPLVMMIRAEEYVENK